MIVKCGARKKFERLTFTADQISTWRLPTRPAKVTDIRARGYRDAVALELDAIEPGRLRAFGREAIEQHLPEHQFMILKAAEESERSLFRQLVGTIGRTAR